MVDSYTGNQQRGSGQGNRQSVKQIIVIGAGITGVCCAEWLRREGWLVTLVDRVRSSDPAQASYGNAGLLARNAIIPVTVPGLLREAPRMLLDPDSPMFLRWSYLPRLLPWLVPFLRNGRPDRFEKAVTALSALTADSVDQHLAIAKGTGAERFIRSGEYAFLYRDGPSFAHDKSAMALRRAHGFEFEIRERKRLLEEDPHLGPDYAFAAVFRDHGWITDPGGYVAALAAHFVQSGGRFELGEVVEIKPGPSPSIILLCGREMSADKIVLAAGIWSRKLVRSMAQDIKLESERGYHLFLKGANIQPPFPYMIADAKFVATPMDAGLRCAGIVELGGLEAGPSLAPSALLRRRIRQVYPALQWDSEEIWMGHRPTLPDSLPAIGNAPKAEGVIYAFGSQHVGLTIGPLVGRIVAGIAADRHSNLDLAPYLPDRTWT